MTQLIIIACVGMFLYSIISAYKKRLIFTTKVKKVKKIKVDNDIESMLTDVEKGKTRR